VTIGDLILTEVLQGFRNDRDFARARSPPRDAPKADTRFSIAIAISIRLSNISGCAPA
jgi:hypothetical protein